MTEELIGCAECGANGGHALYCMACAEKYVKRTWVGLTDDEVYKIAFDLDGEHWRKIADAIEAKLKEKNT
jgi:hypothetical protein